MAHHKVVSGSIALNSKVIVIGYLIKEHYHRPLNTRELSSGKCRVGVVVKCFYYLKLSGKLRGPEKKSPAFSGLIGDLKWLH